MKLAAISVMAFPKRKKHRPPVEGPLRRLPGQSVRDERDRILDDQLLDYLLAGFAFCSLAAWEWLRRWLVLPFAAETMTAFAVMMTAYCGLRIFRLRREVRNLSQAEKGERRVSELLTQLRRRQYVAFDDLVVAGENIDHVVVGPGGIFAIETKAYSIFGTGYVGVDEAATLRVGNKPAIGNPLAQATRCARHVAKLMQDRSRRAYDVKPVLIFPGWKLSRAKAQTGVVVLNEETIVEYFNAQPVILSAAQITEICAHLDQIART